MNNNGELYFGQVMHRRLRPTEHRFVYPVYFCRLPLSRIEGASCALFSVNRFNMFSFRFADHGARDGSHPLPWIRALLEKNGVVADGEIWLQCFPRVLGFVFNPVSFWFCHDRQGAQVAILAEVNNTFGERHNYLLTNADGRPIGDGEVIERSKVFHVSPFLAVAGFYRFRFAARAGSEQKAAWCLARIDHGQAGDEQGDLLHTAISGDARPLTDGNLLKAFFHYPWLTLGVVVRIHWQAFKLWRKRVPFFSKPQPPIEETTR
ncbi:MAG: DUF1365 domain-containing protein [Propionivibrio sp.]